MKLDYRTFWPEEEPPPTTKGEGQRPPLAPRPSLTVGVLPLGPRRRRQQRGTLYLRDCGPRGIYYAVGGWLFGFFGAAILLGLLTLLHSILSALF
jgi:hypothetical protein